MFFIQENIHLPQWTNNWEIRVNWPGSLTTKPNKKPAPQEHYLSKLFSFSNFSSNSFNKTLPKNQYYLQPFFLFSFLTQQSLTKGKVLKLYPGFNFINNNWKTRTYSLFNEIRKFNFFWGLSINDKFKKNCTTHLDKDVLTGGNYYHPPVVKEGFLTFDEAKGMNKYDDTVLNWKQPLLIPLSCLKPDSYNQIKFWWNVKNNSDQFISELMSVEINFFYPKEIELSLNLKESQDSQIKLNYLYLIKTQLGERTQIIPIQNQLIKLKSYLLNSYSENQPFDSLWELEYHPIQVDYEKWKLLLKHFDFKYLKDDLVKFTNWNNFPLGIDVITNKVDLKQNEVLQGKIAFIQNEPKKILLKIIDFKRQHPNSQEINYYKQVYKHIFTTKNTWDFERKKLFVSSFAENTFLSSWQNYINRIVLFNIFTWQNLIPIKFTLNQNTVIENNFFHNKLSLQKQLFKSENHNLDTNEKFIIPVFFLKKIANFHFTFDQYWDYKKRFSLSHV